MHEACCDDGVCCSGLGDSGVWLGFWSLVIKKEGCENEDGLGVLGAKNGVEQVEERDDTDEPTADVVEDGWLDDLHEFGELVSFSFDDAVNKK